MMVSYSDRPSYFISPDGLTATTVVTGTQEIEEFKQLPFKRSFFGKEKPYEWKDLSGAYTHHEDCVSGTRHVIGKTEDKEILSCGGFIRVGRDLRSGKRFIYCDCCMIVRRYLDD